MTLERTPPTAGRAAALLAGLTAVTFGAASCVRSREGQRALAACAEARRRSDASGAIASCRAAVEARCPVCEAPSKGAAELEDIAREAEQKGDDTAAFASFEALRAARAATSVGLGRDPLEARASQELARLGAKMQVAAAASQGRATSAVTAETLTASLAAEARRAPSAMMCGLLGAGTLVFAFGAARLVHADRAKVLDAALALAGVALGAAALAFF